MTEPGNSLALSLQPAIAAARDGLERYGYSRLGANQVEGWAGLDDATRSALGATWNDLPRDAYLRDGGSYRSRRHACFVQDVPHRKLTRVTHRAHWQPTTYNALHGGLERWFEPIDSAVTEAAAWNRLLLACGELFAGLRRVPLWFIEAHQFRIDTASGIGRPTPEGAHRDGVDFIAIVLVARQHVVGGETRVFPIGSDQGVRFTLDEPWSILLLDDGRVVHETTPIQSDDATGWRDTLVITYRADGFQSPG